MADPLVEDLQAAGISEVTAEAPLAELTTLRVGGPARALIEVDDDEQLAAAGRLCREHDVPWAVVGRGSNLLVSDSGWPGVVITLGRGYRMLEISEDDDGTGGVIVAGAAEPLPSLAVRVASAGFAGFAWAAAVPGSLGGAVRMNAGAHGGEMRDHLISADLVRLDSGARETWPVDTLGLTYRHSELPSDAVVVAASLRLVRGDADRIKEEISEIRSWRREHQPINEPNCGSVFTNPPDDSAGRLVDSAGMKGHRVGGASISEVHANFIVTERDATASDVRALVRVVRHRVHEVHGVLLRPEVQMLGTFDDEGLGPEVDGR